VKALFLILLLASPVYAQLTAPADTMVSMPLTEARGIVRGIQLLQADTAKKAQIIFAQDHLLGSLTNEIAIANQMIRKQKQVIAEQAEQLNLAKQDALLYQQIIKEQEPSVLAKWYIQVPIGVILGGIIAYKILK